MFNMINLQNNTMFYSSNSNILSTYKCTKFSIGGGQFLGRIEPVFALVNNDIKDNEV